MPAIYDSDLHRLTREGLGYMVSAGSRLAAHTLAYDKIGRVTAHAFGTDATGDTRQMRWQYAYDDSNAGLP